MWTDPRLAWDPKDFDYCKEQGYRLNKNIVFGENRTRSKYPYLGSAIEAIGCLEAKYYRL